jgi:hypothetical protein
MLHKIDSQVYAHTTDLRIGPGVVFPTRMTVVVLSEGIVLHSPLALDDGLAGAIDSLGDVRWIVAPNDLHHMFLGSAHRRFPNAEVFGTEAAAAKQPDVPFDATLQDLAASPPDAWRGSIQVLGLRGTRWWNESVFWLEDACTLLCSDFVFNIREPANIWTRLLLTLVGAHATLAQSRAERWFLVKDREAFAGSIAQMLEWNIERIIMAHGEIVEEDARRRLAEVTKWAFDEGPDLLEHD